jgi:hypothetical protein
MSTENIKKETRGRKPVYGSNEEVQSQIDELKGQHTPEAKQKLILLKACLYYRKNREIVCERVRNLAKTCREPHKPPSEEELKNLSPYKQYYYKNREKILARVKRNAQIKKAQKNADLVKNLDSEKKI